MSLLKMSFAGAVMILAITVIRALTINRVPKKTFSVLWLTAVIRLMIPFSLPSVTSIYSLLGQKAPNSAANNIANGMLLAAAAQEQAVSVAHTGAVDVPKVSPLMLVWIVGFIGCAAFFITAYIRCYREFQMSLPVENEFLNNWLQTHKLSRTVSVRQSDRISSPLTFGLFKPIILMPKGTDWENENTLKYVLEHEFVHIQRFDTLFKLLLTAVVCVHWFNPMVWIMYTLANRDIELSCDETVINRFGSDTRAAYARVLISMEEIKSGFMPLCNNFSKNTIEERITAIMKTRKTTVLSLVLAVVLVAGTVTVFATSAKNTTNNTAESTATEGGDFEPNREYISAGLTYKNNELYYQGKPVIRIYDDNGGIYMNDSFTDGVSLNIKRDSKNKITDVAIISKEQFSELADKYMNTKTVTDDSTVMSYINPDDGKTYYSFDNGKTFEAMTAEEYDARFPSPNVEWWTYEEYKAWLENEKIQLQSMVGDSGIINGKEFVWTQEKVDETIAEYEKILQDIKNGMMYSKSIDGEDNMAMFYNPADIETSTSDSMETVN